MYRLFLVLGNEQGKKVERAEGERRGFLGLEMGWDFMRYCTLRRKK